MATSKYLDTAGLSYLWDKIKAAIPSTYASSATAGGVADKTSSIPFGKLDSTSTSTVMTAQVEGISELRNGVCMFLMNGVVTSATNFTININGLGAKPVYSTMAAATRASTLFNVNYTGFFVYNEERVSGGCWDFYYGYNSDTNTVGYNVVEYYNGTKRVKTASQRYQVMLTCFDGLLLPVFSGTYTTAATKTLTTEKFNPLGQIYYYNTTTNLAANGTPASGSLYPQAAYSLVDLRYSFNTASTLTAGEDIYLVCKPNIDGSAVLHSEPIAKALPTTEDGLLYKRLGKANDTYRIILELDKPVYYYKNGAIREWTGVDCLDSISQEETFTFAKADKTSNAEIEAVKGNTVVLNQMVKTPNPSSTNNTYWAAYNNSNVSVSYTNTGVLATITNEGSGYSRGIKVSCVVEASHIVAAIIYLKPSVTADFFWEAGNGQGQVVNCEANKWTCVCGKATISRKSEGLIVKPSTTLAVNDTFEVAYASCIDLTLMFGAGNEPSTVEEFETWLTNNIGLKPYYAYNAGELISVKSTGIKTVGFNAWDEEWEVGMLNVSTGQPSSGTDRIRSKNYISVVGGNTYYFCCTTILSSMYFRVCIYDSDYNFVQYKATYPSTSQSNSNYNNPFVIPYNGCYIKFDTNSTYGTTYNHDICINISNSSKNGTYEPYWSKTKALPITTMTGKVNGEGSSVVIFPDGMKRAGNVYDEIKIENGVVKAVKRVGSVDLGTLNWTYSQYNPLSYFSTTLASREWKLSSGNQIYNWFLTPNYKPTFYNNIGQSNSDKTISGGTLNVAQDRLYIVDSSYTDAAAFKASLLGVILYYELATPIEYIVDDFTLPVTVKMDEWGTKLMLPENTSTVTTLSPTLSVEYPSTESALERKIEGANERVSDLVSLYTKPHHPLHENVRGFWDIIDYGDSAYTSRVEAFMRTNGTRYDSYASYSIHFDALSTDDYFNLYIDGDNIPILYQHLSSGDTTVDIINYPPNTYRYVVGNQEGTFTIAQERLFYNTPSGIRNVRDLGGMIGAQGCKIRYGWLIRGRAITSYDDYQMGWLNVNVYSRHNNMQGSRFVYSLAQYNEISGEYCYNRFALTSSYSLISQIANGIVSENTTQLKNAIKSIIAKINENNAIYFCCKLGTHRTGVVASILEGLLGCSASDIEKDFELSSGIEQTWSRNGNEVGQADAFRFIRENYNGSWYQWGVENLGLTLEEIETFRYVMLEDYVPNISTYPIWKEDDVLYVERDNSIYPVSHPDLSTQPSILPQRFGVFDIKEVLVKDNSTLIAYNWSPVIYNNIGPAYLYDGDISLNNNNGETRVIETTNGEIALCNYANGEYSITEKHDWYQVSTSYDFAALSGFEFIYPLYTTYPYFKYCIATNSGLTYKYFKWSYSSNHYSFAEVTLDELREAGYDNCIHSLDPEIPSSATIISASSFNADACVPAICKKEDGKWTISNNEGIEPDFTRVQYYEASEGYYFVPQEQAQEQERTVIATLRSDSAARTVPGLNVEDVWGDIIMAFTEGSIIGRVTIDGGTPIDLIVAESSATVTANFALYRMDIPRLTGMAATLYDSFDLTVELYAL